MSAGKVIRIIAYQTLTTVHICLPVTPLKTRDPLPIPLVSLYSYFLASLCCFVYFGSKQSFLCLANSTVRAIN